MSICFFKKKPKSFLSVEQQAALGRQEESKQRMGQMERAMRQMERTMEQSERAMRQMEKMMEEMRIENRRAMNIGEEMNQEHEG